MQSGGEEGNLEDFEMAIALARCDATNDVPIAAARRGSVHFRGPEAAQ